MLQYSFSTVLMAVLSSNIIIIFTAICFCHKDILISIGYKMFALLLGITLLRILFPFQFSFTTNLNLPNLPSKALSFLRYFFYQTKYFNVSIWNIFKLIWVVGVLVKLVRFIKEQLVFNRWVVWHGIDITDEKYYSDPLNEICNGKPNPFCVIELQELDVPVLYGIRNPRILVPAGMKMPEYILRYLLSHETAHHFHHDILIKTGINLLTIAYWWNPACYLLKAQFDAILEMRIDHYVAGNTFESKFGYLSSLVYIAEYSADKTTKRIKVPENSIALLNSHTFNNLVNRFNIIKEEPKPYSKLLHVATFAITIALYLFSYLFIFEAWYATPESNVIESSDSSVYAILTEDSTYEIYYGGFLLETVESLENRNRKMPIYNSLDEVPAELRIIIEQ